MTRAKSLAKAIDELKLLADDCEELSRIIYVSNAEQRTWKSIERQLKRIILKLEKVQ